MTRANATGDTFEASARTLRRTAARGPAPYAAGLSARRCVPCRCAWHAGGRCFAS